MPAVSQAESRYLNAKFGHAWVKEHHFDNSPKGLPQHAPKRHKVGVVRAKKVKR